MTAMAAVIAIVAGGLIRTMAETSIRKVG